VEHSACVVRAATRLRFITAIPSNKDGKETLLRHRNFQIVVASPRSPLSWIMRSPALCASSSSIYLSIMPLAAQRKEMDNSLRNLIDSIGTDELLSCDGEEERYSWKHDWRCDVSALGRRQVRSKLATEALGCEAK